MSLIPPAEALRLDGLVTPTPQGIASRVLAKASGGNLTMFALDAGEGLAEHTSPYEAFVVVTSGRMRLNVGGTVLEATPGALVRMPAGVPHALDAVEATRMLLIMLRA
jgi:quercetin dioxygenase-like cupin family protein